MGTVKKYRGMRAIECFNANSGTFITSSNQSFNTIDYRDTTGTAKTTITFNRDNYQGISLFQDGISAIASADKLSDFTGEEYANDGIGTTSILSNNLTRQADKVTRLVEVKISNTTENSITIGCIKIIHKSMLCIGYYFDNPLTLAAGEEVVKTLRFEFGN